MDESGGRVTRLRRRLSTELLEDASSPLTPTKKRVAKLAAKPQLDNINENAVVESPKRVTRRSLAAEVEPKPLTPLRRSTRTKSNTSLTDVVEIIDSPRAKRVTRRASMQGSDYESPAPNTPITRTRAKRMSLDSAPSSQGAPKSPKKKAENPPAIKQKADQELGNTLISIEEVADEENSYAIKQKADHENQNTLHEPDIFVEEEETEIPAVIKHADHQKENSLNGLDKVVNEEKSNTVHNQENLKDGAMEIISKISELESDVLDSSSQKLPTGLSVPVRRSPRLSAKSISPPVHETETNATKINEMNSSSISNEMNAEEPDIDTSHRNLLDDIEDRCSKNKMSTSDQSIKISTKSFYSKSPPNNKTRQQKTDKFMSDSELIKKHAGEAKITKGENFTYKTKSKKYGSETNLNLSLSMKRKPNILNKSNEKDISNDSVEPMEVDETIPATFNISIFDKISKTETFLPATENGHNDSLDETNLSRNKNNSSKLEKELVIQSSTCDNINKEQNLISFCIERNKYEIHPNGDVSKLTLNNLVADKENQIVEMNSTQSKKPQKTVLDHVKSFLGISKLSKSSIEDLELDKSSKEISKHDICSNEMQTKAETSPKNGTPKINKKMVSLGISTSTPMFQESQTKTNQSPSVNKTLINSKEKDNTAEEDNCEKEDNSSDTSSENEFSDFGAEDAGDDNSKEKDSTDEDNNEEEDNSEKEDNNSDTSSENKFIGEAEDAGDDYQSGDSQDESERLFEEQNQIPVHGESIESTSEDESDRNSEYEKDSFVVSSDEEDDEMLSGTGDDLTMSDNELTQSAKSKEKYDERKVKEQKKASREMFEARHGIDSKKKSFSEESEEETEVAMNIKRYKKRMRLDSPALSNKSDVIEDEKEITINNDVTLSKDPLSVSLSMKEEPNSANITQLEAVIEVEIDENKSMFVTKDKSCDPLVESEVQNDDDSGSLTSENEEIANDYNKMLEVLNKCNDLKRKHKSLGHFEQAETNDSVVDKLNLTNTKSKKIIFKTTESTSQATKSIETNDIPNESNKTPQKDSIEDTEIPSSKKKKHKKCWEDNYNSESQNNSIEVTTYSDLSNEQNKLFDSFVTSTTPDKKTKKKKSLNGSKVNKSKNFEVDVISEIANKSTTKTSKKTSQKAVLADGQDSDNSSDDIDMKSFLKDDSEVSELGDKVAEKVNSLFKDNSDISELGEKTATGKNISAKATAITSDSGDQKDKKSSKKRRRRRKRKEDASNSTLDSSTSNKENNLETSKSDATEEWATVSSTSQASSKLTKSKKRRLKRLKHKASKERRSKVVETLKPQTVRTLPEDIIESLQEPRNKPRTLVVSTAPFEVDLVTRKRCKPSDTLDESVLLPEIPKATNNSGAFKVSKKSKVFPSIAGSASITGCTTQFQIIPIPAENIKMSATQVMPGSSSFKEQYLYGGRIKRIASEQLTSKYKKLKTTKF